MEAKWILAVDWSQTDPNLEVGVVSITFSVSHILIKQKKFNAIYAFWNFQNIYLHDINFKLNIKCFLKKAFEHFNYYKSLRRKVTWPLSWCNFSIENFSRQEQKIHKSEWLVKSKNEKGTPKYIRDSFWIILNLCCWSWMEESNKWWLWEDQDNW